MRVQNLLATVLLAGSVFGSAVGAHAEEKALSVAAVQQLALADNLIAVGVARKDPLLLLAAVRVRTGLTAEAAPLLEDVASNEDVLAKAAEFGEGREDVAALIEDIKAEGSRGYYSGNQYCYTRGSATICN